MNEDPNEEREAVQAPGEEAEERIADRVAVKLPVKLELDTAQNEQTALTGNVSDTGMYLAFKLPPPVGTLARFELQRSDGPPVRGIGEVVWIRVRWTGKGRPPGMGIRFRYLDKGGRESLRALIEDGIARGLRIEGVVDTDREAPRPEEEEIVLQHRPYGKPLTMTDPVRPQASAGSGPSKSGSEEPSQGWEALRKWANSPAPVRAGTAETDSAGRTATPLLGNLGDKAKLIVFLVLLLVFLIVVL